MVSLKHVVRDGFLRISLTTYNGYLTHEETSALQNRPWIRPEEILGIADRQLDRLRLLPLPALPI